MLHAIVAAKTGSFMEMIDRIKDQTIAKLKSLPAFKVSNSKQASE